MLIELSQVYYWRYNGKNVIIYTNIDATLYLTFGRVIIMAQKSACTLEVKGGDLI